MVEGALGAIVAFVNRERQIECGTQSALEIACFHFLLAHPT